MSHMECNKDEASRAKSIAELKLEQKDYSGAKKFAMKAQTLYPGLEGISQMLTTLDVYLSAENKINGEVDWYRVLNVNPSADDDTIKRQYRKLALSQHPDKNSSVGADGAFKLISEAWSLLSDKAKRSAYNQRRGNRVFYQNVQLHTGGPSAPPRPSQKTVPTHTGGPPATSWPSQQSPCRPNQQKVPTHTGGTSAPSIPSQYFNCARWKNSPSKSQNRSSKVPKTSPPTPPHQRSDTFWTTCARCSTQYEYLKTYHNCTLLCHNCKHPFLASEKAPPANYSKSANMWQQRSSVSNSASRNAYDPGRNAPAAKKSGLGQSDPCSFRDGNHQQGPLPRAADIGSPEPSIVEKVGDVLHEVKDEVKRPYIEPNATAGRDGCFKKTKLGDDSSNIAQGHSMLTPHETRKGSMVNAQKEIVEKTNDGNTENESSTRTTEQSEEHRMNPADNGRKEHPNAVTIDVPDSDFYNFDVDRSQSSFSDHEVWAAYDDDDGMPRLYALIHKVVSRDPFELKISWLSSKSNTEFSNIKWVSSGFYKTCGEFSVGRPRPCRSINAFSQRVHWSKHPNGRITILPRKGDSWALYRNWSSDWSSCTPDDVVHRYDMVMVVDEYNEERGIPVAPLVKVPGFSTVFLANLDSGGMKRISKEEMFRFSHRVPHHVLSRDESPGAPQGSVELDPAATPLELLQKTAENGV